MAASAAKPKIVLIAGSLRVASTNTGLLRAAQKLFPADVEVVWAPALNLPIYNGDIEAKGQPTEVKALWDLLHSADGVLIGNPEYNGRNSAALSNALDWVSRPVHGSPPLTGLPIASVGSGGGGGAAESEAALQKFVLRQKGEWVASATPVHIQQWTPPMPKFNDAGDLTHLEAIPAIQSVVDAIVAAAKKRQVAKAAAPKA